MRAKVAERLAELGRARVERLLRERAAFAAQRREIAAATARLAQDLDRRDPPELGSEVALDAFTLLCAAPLAQRMRADEERLELGLAELDATILARRKEAAIREQTAARIARRERRHRARREQARLDEDAMLRRAHAGEEG